ncbi:hypothetical protein CS542_09475 [Pedobacter sp. IW39]|nr:hypothetical protein CS542_09475 [Pedobacter sp. IW39]
MRNGEGDQLLVLFEMKEHGVFRRSRTREKDKLRSASSVPGIHFRGTSELCRNYIFGMAIKRSALDTGIPAENDDHSAELLSPLDAEPATYIKWASDWQRKLCKAEFHWIPSRIFNQEPQKTWFLP